MKYKTNDKVKVKLFWPSDGFRLGIIEICSPKLTRSTAIANGDIPYLDAYKVRWEDGKLSGWIYEHEIIDNLE